MNRQYKAQVLNNRTDDDYSNYDDADEPLSLGQKAALGAVWITLLTAFWWTTSVSESILLIGTYNLSVQDPMFVATTLAFILNFFISRKKFDLIYLLSLILLILTAICLLRGIIFGDSPALPWLRSYGLTFPYILLGVTVPYSRIFAEKLSSSIIMVSSLIMLLMVARGIFGVSFLMSAGGAGLNEGRSISAHGAIILLLSQAVFLGKYISIDYRKKHLFWSILSMLFIFASGQGTISICSLMIFGVVFGFSPGRFAYFRKILFGMSVICAILILLIGPDAIFSIFDPDWSSRRLNNLGFRETIWNSFLLDLPNRTLTDQIFGMPAGQGQAIYVTRSMKSASGTVYYAQEWNSGLHSMYLGLVNGLGYAGLAVYTLILTITSVTILLSSQYNNESWISKWSSLALVASAIIFGYSYDLRGESMLILFVPLIYTRQSTLIKKSRMNIYSQV